MLLVSLTIVLCAPPVLAGGLVTVQATLILASNEGAPQDPRLEFVEYRLRRIFGFEYYRHLGEASVSVPVGGSTTLALGDGNSLFLDLASDEGKIRAHVRWMRGQDRVLETVLRAKPGVPSILGGVPQGKGTLIVVLVAR